MADRLSEREVRRAAFSLLNKETMQISCERQGLSWTVDTGDEIGEAIYVDGQYQGEEIDALLTWLGGTGKTDVVDIGANVGTTSIPLARAGYRVLAIEPVPSTFAMLVQNVQSNGLAESIRCVNRAVSTTAGAVEMWVTAGSGLSELAVEGSGPGFSHIDPSFAEKRRLVTVGGDRLDRLLTSEHVAFEDVALVWCDAQGSEPYVLGTGVALWEAGVPLYIEVEPYLLTLHGGVDPFVDQVVASFSHFLSQTALLAGGRPEPIEEFRGFVNELHGIAFSNALLIP